MATTKNIYFRDEISEKLKEINNISKLINDLLNDYFNSNSGIMEKKKEDLKKEIEDLTAKTEFLKIKEKEESEKKEKENKLKQIIKETELPNEIIEWIKNKLEIPLVLEISGYLKAKGMDCTPEIRNKIFDLWKSYHENS